MSVLFSIDRFNIERSYEKTLTRFKKKVKVFFMTTKNYALLQLRLILL